MMKELKDNPIRRRVMIALWAVAGLALLLVAASFWQNYTLTHRSPNRYEDELPLYQIVAVGKPSTETKEKLRAYITTADTLYNTSPQLQETRWYKDMMHAAGTEVTLTPEDILIMGMYVTNAEDRESTIRDFQGQTIEVAYNGDGAYILGGAGDAGSIFDKESKE